MKEDARKFLGISDNRSKPPSKGLRRRYGILALLSPFLGLVLGLSYAYIQMAISGSGDPWGMFRFYLGLIGTGIGIVAALLFGILTMAEKK